METVKSLLRGGMTAVCAAMLLTGAGAVTGLPGVNGAKEIRRPAMTAASAVTAADQTAVPVPDGYTAICRSGDLVMAADTQTGLFCLVSEKDGSVWRSVPEDTSLDPYSRAGTRNIMRSQVVIAYIVTEDEVKSSPEKEATSAVDSVPDVEVLADGLRVRYTFEAAGIAVPVEYRLANGYFYAAVDTAGIGETGEHTLTSVLLLPSFGAGNWTAEGYLFVPDGSGALIGYNNGGRNRYEKRVYGDELAIQYDTVDKVSENIRLPVFGLVTNGAGLIGIIEEGAAAASVAAWNGSDICGYNAVGTRLILHTNYRKSMFYNQNEVNRLTPEDAALDRYTVRYYPLTGGDADYSGMARVYREYLMSEKGLEKRAAKPSLHLNLYGSIDVKANFLGFTYTGQRGLTTFQQAREIVDGLAQQGVRDISVRLIGWGKDGVSNGRILKNAKASGILGGNKGLLSLSAYMEEQGMTLILDADLLSYRKGSERAAAKTVYNETAFQYVFSRSVYKRQTAYMLLSPDRLEETANRYLTSFKKLGLAGISLSSLTDTLYSNLERGRSVSRTQMAAAAERTLAAYRAAGMELAGRCANDYAAVYLSRIYETPTRSSGEAVFDREIPFYQMVFHGLISMTAQEQISSPDARRNILKAAESGLELLWNGMAEDASVVSDTRYHALYGTTVSLWREDAVRKHQSLLPLLDRVYDQLIVSHSEPRPDVTKTVYENGVTVYVNYTDEAVTADGVTVGGMDFAVEEGTA